MDIKFDWYLYTKSIYCFRAGACHWSHPSLPLYAKSTRPPPSALQAHSLWCWQHMPPPPYLPPSTLHGHSLWCRQHMPPPPSLPPPCRVTFGAGSTYSFTSGTFTDVGQNVSFTADRVNMTNYGYSKRQVPGSVRGGGWRHLSGGERVPGGRPECGSLVPSKRVSGISIVGNDGALAPNLHLTLFLTCAPPSPLPPPLLCIHPLSGTLSSIVDIGNGVNSAAGSQCINTTWTDGSTPSSFLGTLVQSIGGYYIYLEEGIRAFVSGEGVGGRSLSGLLYLLGRGEYPHIRECRGL